MPTVEVEMPFVGGMDEQTERRLLPFGRLRKAENVWIDRDGRLSKRNGFASLTMQDLGGGSLSTLSTVRLVQWRDELVLLDESAVYRYISDEDKFDKALTSDCYTPECSRVVQDTIARDPGEHIDVGGVAYANGYTLYGWARSDGYLGMRVRNEATGTDVYHTVGLQTTARQVRCFASGNYLYCGYVREVGAPYDVRFYRFDTTSPNAAPASYNPAALLVPVANYSWDVHVSGSSGREIVIGFTDNGGGASVYTYNESLTAQDNANVGGFVPTEIAVYANANYVWLGFFDAVNGYRARSYEDDLTNPTATVVLEAGPIASKAPFVVGGVDATTARFYWSDTYTATYVQPRLTMRTMTTAAALGGVLYQYGLAVASKPVLNGTRSYIWGVYDNVAQTSLQKYYVLTEYASNLTRPVARVSYRDARGEFNSVQAVSEQAALASGSYIWAAPRTYAGLVNLVDPETGLDSYRYSLIARDRMQVAEHGGLVITGGVPYVYDGDQTHELLPVQAPDWCNTAIGAAGVLNGTYTYVAIYERTDATGRKVRSAVSPQVSASPVTQEVVVTAPWLRVTEGDYAGGGYTVRFYRTKASGTEFYELASVMNLTTPATAASYTDNIPDATLELNPLLYTTSGEPETFCPPPCDAICSHGDRLWLACGNRVYYSHKTVPEEGATFTETFYVTLPETVTALASFDSALVIFSATSIYLLFGDGPNRLGQDAYVNPQRLTGAVGCVNARSVAIIPQGIVFLSDRGFEILPRGGGAVEYIGQWVRNTLATYPDVTSAVVDAPRSQVLFTVVDDEDAPPVTGRVLVYNYRVGQWTAWTAPAYGCAAMWDGDFTVATCAGSPVYKQGTTFTDTGGAWITMTIETGDIRPSGIMRYQRLQRVNVLGEHRGRHKLTISVAYDGANSFTDSDQKAWNEAAASPLRQEYAPSRQKLEAIRVQLQDAVDSGVNEGLALNALAIQVKTKRKPSKLAVAARG